MQNIWLLSGPGAIPQQRIGHFKWLYGTALYRLDRGVVIPPSWGIWLEWDGVTPFSMNIVSTLIRYLRIPPTASAQVYCEGVMGMNGIFTGDHRYWCPQHTMFPSLEYGLSTPFTNPSKSDVWTLDLSRIMARELLITNDPAMYYTTRGAAPFRRAPPPPPPPPGQPRRRRGGRGRGVKGVANPYFKIRELDTPDMYCPDNMQCLKKCLDYMGVSCGETLYGAVSMGKFHSVTRDCNVATVQVRIDARTGHPELRFKRTNPNTVQFICLFNTGEKSVYGDECVEPPWYHCVVLKRRPPTLKSLRELVVTFHSWCIVGSTFNTEEIVETELQPLDVADPDSPPSRSTDSWRATARIGWWMERSSGGCHWVIT